ncbi:metal-binding protein [mine drainage metagenome]|uniref:Metal-binding protein n=1 Tax=mine drainage metagenome TaxID=410659 RepID=T0Y878_9ZZZZ
MAKKYTFACKDIGQACSFVAEDENRNALMQKIAEHAKAAHSMEIDKKLQNTVDKAIKKVEM